MLFEAFPFRGKANEDEAAIALDARHLHHRGVRIFRIEIGRIAVLQRDGFQLAVEVIGPAVVAALEFIRAAAVIGNDHRATVGALIVQRPHPPFGVAHDDNRLARDTRTEIVARLFDLTLVSDIDPGARKDAGHLQFENVRIRVDAAMHARGLHQPGKRFRRALGRRGHMAAPSSIRLKR